MVRAPVRDLRQWLPRRRARWSVWLAVAGVLIVTACAGGGATPTADPTGRTEGRPAVQAPPPDPAPAARGGTRPNIVLVMMDDFSLDLVQTMRSAKRMARTGARYTHAFSVDSLCCVSRSSIFTGQYPHQTGVLTNTSNKGTSTLGGWPAFELGGNPERSFNVRLNRSGYATGFVGKYLNEYEWTPGRALPPVPPGWSTFNVIFGSAYDGWDFASTYLDKQGRLGVREHPAPPSTAGASVKDAASAAAVTEDLALDFITAGESGDSPYFLEVATYAPHNRTQPEGYYPGDPLFPPLFRDRAGERSCGRIVCSRLTVEDLPGFGDKRRDNRPRSARGKRARAWNTGRTISAEVAVRDLRDRARMSRSIDRLVAKILEQVGPNTYVILTSDNGFHLGQNGLGRGKGTAYDTDSHVPLYVVGPDVVRGPRAEVTSNIDLAPTIEELAGLRPPGYRSGVSLVPTLGDRRLVRRDYAFLEHTQQTLTGNDPDRAFTGSELDRIPSYTAVRSRTGLLVRLDLDPRPTTVQWGYEFYSYRTRSWEKRNQYAAKRHRAEVRRLKAKLEEFDGCRQARGQRVPAKCRNLTR